MGASDDPAGGASGVVTSASPGGDGSLTIMPGEAQGQLVIDPGRPGDGTVGGTGERTAEEFEAQQMMTDVLEDREADPDTPLF